MQVSNYLIATGALGVIYDVLRAPEPHRYDWLLHAANEMQVNEGGRKVPLIRVLAILPPRAPGLR